DERLSGPYTHANLTVFLVHGKDTLPGTNFLTLPEALEQKKVVVYETQNVNELSVENLSDSDVFIHAGDIVKGGQQDRLIAFDLILPAKSGKVEAKSGSAATTATASATSGRVTLPAFCVEQGRWAQRGGEVAQSFASAANNANSKDLKIASGKAR